jgi:hypothetical protein
MQSLSYLKKIYVKMNYTKSYYITNIFVIDRFLSTEIPNFEKKPTDFGM